MAHQKEDMDGGLMYQQLRKFINVIVSIFSIYVCSQLSLLLIG